VANSGEWVSLQKAADLLGVHPTTLRRWADDKQIDCVVTAGGHRRFSIKKIEAFLEKQRGGSANVGEWADRAVVQARSQVAQNAAGQWMQHMDDATRERHRVVGKRLMGLTLQFVSTDGELQPLLDEARTVGAEYGALSKTSGVPLRDALEAALFFRDRLLEATWDMPATRSGANPERKLDRRINTLLNAVQLAIADVYENDQAL
jgi:excisionase family DNA binding protein